MIALMFYSFTTVLAFARFEALFDALLMVQSRVKQGSQHPVRGL